NGGWLKPGMGGVNLSAKPEPVFNARQWDTLRRVVAQHDSATVRPLGGTSARHGSDGRQLATLERIETRLASLERTTAGVGPHVAKGINQSASTAERNRRHG